MSGRNGGRRSRAEARSGGARGGSGGGAVHTCGFCGVDFREDRGQPACRRCPLARACRFVRCPECGYENPVTPDWLDRLPSWMTGADG